MSIERVLQVAEKFQKNSAAPLGFAFRDLNSGRTISYHGEQPFPTASAYKIYILAELFRKVYAGECRLSDRHPHEPVSGRFQSSNPPEAAFWRSWIRGSIPR